MLCCAMLLPPPPLPPPSPTYACCASAFCKLRVHTQVRSDVAALALEEVAPLAVSTAALAAPSEVYKAAAPGGEGKAEQELSR